MKKLAILIVSTMALAATGCCGLHGGGGGCNSCGYGGAAPTFGGGGGCPNGNCGLGPTSYIAPTGTASAISGNTPTLATAPVAHQPFQRTAMARPVEALPTF